MVKLAHNPFTPTFGCVPPELAGRDTLITDILEGLDNAPGDPNRATIFVGARGTGKTVLLTAVAERAEMRGWVSVNVTDRYGMLSEIIVQLRQKASHLLTPETYSWLSEIHVHGVGFTRTKEEAPSTWRADMTKAIGELNEKDTGLLITVDEVSAQSDELSVLIDSFQHFVRERRDVALLLAGLPHNVSTHIDVDATSFLRRAFKHSMDQISATDTSYAIKETVEGAGRGIAVDALKVAADASEGYAFLIQLLGYHAWRQHPERGVITLKDMEQAVAFARDDMYRMVLEPTVNSLSERELEFLTAMAEGEGPHRVSDIAGLMGISENNATKIRARLIEQEIIGARRRGFVDFDMPMIRDYLTKGQYI